jgi:hypothetical protein
MYKVFSCIILATGQQDLFKDLVSIRPVFYLSLDISPARRLMLLFFMGTLLSLFECAVICIQISSSQ